MTVHDAAAFRALADGLVELATRWIAAGDGLPVTTGRSPAELRARLDEPLPRRGRPAAEVLRRLEEDVVADATRLVDPRFAAHQVAPPLPAAAAVDVLVSTMNNGLAVWEMSPTGTLVEHVVLGWLARLAGFDPDACGGTFVSGGAVGTLTGLAAARARALPDAWTDGVGERPAAIVASSAAHYCVARAAGVLGLGTRALALVPADARGRLDPAAADAELRRAREAGRTVVALVATAGTTPVGAIDPLAELAGVAADHGAWLHVDAAHGGALLLSERLRPRLAGVERADSVAIDLHKTMLQPISTALVLVRERARLRAAFAQDAPYLFRDREAGSDVDLGPYALQCSRRLDALRAWTTLQLHGADGVAAMQERCLELAQALQERVRTRPRFEAVHEPETNIVCFRHVPDALAEDPAALDRHQLAVRERARRAGRAHLSATTLDGRVVLRAVLLNPDAGPRHLDAILDAVDEVDEAGDAAGDEHA